MLKAISFILKFVADFMKMLFTIDVDNDLSFGLLFCVIFILLPIIHRIICFIKQDAIDELNDKYEESRPRESWTATKERHARTSDGGYLSTHHSFYKSRRYKR